MGDNEKKLRSSKLYRLALAVISKRKIIVSTAVMVTLVSLVVGGSFLPRFSLAQFTLGGSESVRASEVLERDFGVSTPNLTIVVEAKQGTVDDAAVAVAGASMARQLAQQAGVVEVASYWTRGMSPVLRSNDGRQALIIARVAGDATQARAAIGEISPKFSRDTAVLLTLVGGRDEAFRQVAEQTRRDFVRAELIILPSMIILLYIVYRRLSAALVTLGIGIFSVFTTLALLGLMTAFVDISTFASNFALIMGLGLGLDYCLLIIMRYRERLLSNSDASVSEAIAYSVATAGRTVLFSGCTAALSLMALLYFPFPFLQSFAYAGLIVAVTVLVGAIIVLPAALSLLGRRVERRDAAQSEKASATIWHRIAERIIRRPAIFAALGIVFILVLSSPVLQLQLGMPDDRSLPPEATSRQAQQQIRDNFIAEEADSFQIVSGPIGDPDDRLDDIINYAKRLSQVAGVAQVDSLAGSYANGQRLAITMPNNDRFANQDRTWLSIIPESERLNDDGRAFVAEIRAVSSPFTVLIGGSPAEVADFQNMLIQRLPVVLAFILIATFGLLFLMTGSLLLPLLATILNSMSIAVMLGVIVWVFQEGHLSGLLNVTATGWTEPSIPLLMLCAAYGLSMDYQVFIISRIKEAYQTTGDTRRAIIDGLQHAAPIIFAASAILALTFSVYASADVVQLKMLAVGLTTAVLVDATIIRLILLPSLMSLAGNASWWLPAWLDKLYGRIGLRD